MAQHDLPKAYDFKATEPRIYQMWETGGHFRPWNEGEVRCKFVRLHIV